MAGKDVILIGVDHDINEAFRMAIGLKYGYGRKYLRIAINEAFKDWTEKTQKENGK